ncbi:hypothetical protein [Chryseobacterium sp. R2A-55]|uniref:hypothetical protein n=1 Tax=Chryseobacterium sp. R2A-55 TaxID=2744445 RepID=UPI001F289CE7|nr:hypothetical protein [Chryseobacterium sp. R2A-55]
MKKLFLLSIFSLFLTGCSPQIKTLANGKQIDTRLAGVWTGSEKDQQIDGVSKSWEMKRMDDGTYTINFKFTQDEITDTTHEEGKWWTENGKYYEFHDYDGKTDVYSYTVLDSKRVKFKSEQITVGMENNGYEFIDTKTGN